ncbi:hypothetical protein NN4_24770 [Nocardia ninae NBRC 108245]|uniref:Uncharacterized protein n=1 Tax=Nocardia ninae NBRC 108245 TaxID=1210091 RepID=A0A511MCY3_9NOCA|nr:hypothetical protein NN4_24770 [Nocardia ninae NBRC 108245]
MSIAPSTAVQRKSPLSHRPEGGSADAAGVSKGTSNTTDSTAVLAIFPSIDTFSRGRFSERPVRRRRNADVQEQVEQDENPIPPLLFCADTLGTEDRTIKAITYLDAHI